MKKLFFTLILLLGTHLLWAQTEGGTQVGSEPNKDNPDVEAFREKCRQQVKSFQEYISTIAEPNAPAEDKQMAVEGTLAMFLKGSTIQVSSVKNPKQVKTYSLNEYLQNLSLLSKRYKVVEMSVYKPAKIADFTKNPDGTWSGNATYFQRFSGVTSSGAKLHDEVAKRMEAYIKKQKDQFTNVDDWMLLLGNISVVEVNNVPIN